MSQSACDPPIAITKAPALQTMSWPTYHSMTDTDLKAIYAYLSALPQTTACNTVQNGCAGFFGDAKGGGRSWNEPVPLCEHRRLPEQYGADQHRGRR
jgi:hypothetical protein